MPDAPPLTEEDAWDEAARRNAELGRQGERRRYAVAEQQADGTWVVTLTTADPPRSRWKGVGEWLRSWLPDDTTPRKDDPATFDEAVARLRGDDVMTRRLAVDEVARLFPDQAAGVLSERLDDEDSVVRGKALKALAKASGRAAWPTLVVHLGDPEEAVARSAWLAMHGLSGRGDIAELLELAEAARHPSIGRAMRTRATYLDTR
jgi:hypothetical protein